MYTSDQNTALGIHIVLPLLAIASTILRFAARSARSNPIGIDDWFVLLSTILCLSLGVTIIYGAVDGCFGVPVTTLAAEQYVCLGKILYAEPAVSFAALGFIKLGILYFYKRIFTIRYFTITSNVFITLVTMWTIGALVGELFQQWPVEANWSIPHDPSASILNYPDFLMAIASSDLALDVAILCLPIHPITKLHMSSRKKYSLLGIFALGSLCCIAEAVRIYQQYEYLFAQTDEGPIASDFENVFLMIDWQTVEVCLSIVAANLPVMTSLFLRGHSSERPISRLRYLLPFSKRTTLASGGSSQGYKDSVDRRKDQARDRWIELHNKGHYERTGSGSGTR